MSGAALYDALQIAYEFVAQAEQLAGGGDYDAAQALLEKAKSYAFNNVALLDDICLRGQTMAQERWQYIKQLEGEAADLFSQERFEGQKGRQVLQTLLQQDGQNELARNLWAELPARENTERERRMVEDFQQELERLWQRAGELEEMGAGSRAVAEYERALLEAAKKVGDAPGLIPLQHLKLTAAERRDRAKDKWVGTPTLILARKGQELVDRYETLKQQGEIETEFFDENGEFLGRLPIDECIERAKKLASRFAEQKAQDYLGQARELLAESPGAAYDKIQDALALAYPSDFAKSILEQELREKILPAIQLREKALAQLKAAMSKEAPVAAWTALREAEQVDRHTPGLEDARQRLLPILGQKFDHLLEAGQRLQNLEDFETARTRFQAAIEIGQLVFACGEGYQGLYAKAQAAFERCVQAERIVAQFDQTLADIAQQSQTEPEQAKKRLGKLATDDLSDQAKAKVERLRVQIDFKMGLDQLFNTLEQKMLAAREAVELIPLEEGGRQISLDQPNEQRFARLVERIAAHRSFLHGARLRENPEKHLEAQALLQKVIEQRGDDAAAAQAMLDEIAANEQQEADITIAVQEASAALESDDFRAAFLRLEPYRYSISRQAGQVRQLFNTAATHWRQGVEQQLEALVSAGDFNLPKVDLLLQELALTQSPRLHDWQIRVLAPAYAKTAADLQELNRWDQASLLWEEAFRLSPGDPRIQEGRRNAQKHRDLIRAQMTFDPTEREGRLNELNHLYSDDPTVKRYLAEFYYNQDRYVEARLAISQVKFLAEHLAAPTSNSDARAIQRLEALIQQAEKIEKQKFAIRSQLTGKTTVGELREARRAYEQLLESAPEQGEKLQAWWEEQIKESVNQMKAQIAKLSDAGGTVWARAELWCKILALQADPQLKAQAERMLRLAYSQLPADIQAVTGNPAGIGYGPGGQALTNHINRAKDLYKRLVNMSQVERVAADLGITLTGHNLDLNETLYNLELLLENLYFAQERQRDIKSQIVAALMTGRWETLDDGLKELALRGISQHRGAQDLPAEVERAKTKRLNMETAVAQLKEAIAQEAYQVAQDRLQYMRSQDPADETQLQSTLEVVDPYTGLTIKGHRELAAAITEKLAVVEKLKEWRASCKPPVDWKITRLKMTELANSGAFSTAIELGLAVTGQSDKHQAFFQDDSWSLGHLRQYLERPPLSQDQLNTLRAQAMFEQANQKTQILIEQFDECDLLLQELRQKEQEFKQIMNALKPLLKRLNESKDFLSALWPPAAELQEVRRKVTALIEQGRQLCPNYPAFARFEEGMLLGK